MTSRNKWWNQKKFKTIFFTTKNYLRPKSFRLIRPFYRVPVFLLGRPSKLPSVLYTLRGWHWSGRLVHFFRAIYERKKCCTLNADHVIKLRCQNKFSPLQIRLRFRCKRPLVAIYYGSLRTDTFHLWIKALWKFSAFLSKFFEICG